MPSFVTPKKNTQFIFYVGLVSQANTKILQANPTLAAADFNVSGDGGALGALGTTPTVTPAAGRMVKVTLSTTEMNFDNVTLVCSDSAGAEWCDLIVNIQTSARQVDDLAWPTTTGRSLDVSATGEAGIDWANIGTPGSTQSLSATTVATVTTVTNQLTAAQVATGVWQDAVAGDFTVASSIGKTLYIANIVPGGSGGLMISGTNAGTTTLGALTITGATTLTGNVVLSDGLTISAPSTLNRAGFSVTGNGTGAGVIATGGATGNGLTLSAGATSGHGLISTATGTSFNGLRVVGSPTTGEGLLVIGGSTSGDGIKVTTTSGHGLNLAPVGISMHGILSTGGNGGTSDGIKGAAGTGGVDVRGNITGNLVGTVSTLTTYTGNTPQTGDVFPLASTEIADIKTKTDFLPSATAGAAGGLFIAGTNAATTITTGLTTTFTGNLTGSVASVTGAVGSLTTNSDKTGYSLGVGGIGATAFAAGAIDSAAIATGAIDADAIAANAIGASELAADAANEIADATMQRASSNWEVGAPVKSLGVAIMKATHRTKDNAGSLEIYRSDGLTIHATQTVTTDAANLPVDELTGAV